VVVEYVHGEPRVMGDGGNVAMLRAAMRLQPGISSTASTVVTPDGTAYSYDPAGQVTAAGTSVNEVLSALDRAAEALHRQRPAVPGRVFGLIRQVPGTFPPAPTRDDRVHTPDGRPVFFSYALFVLYSTAA